MRKKTQRLLESKVQIPDAQKNFQFRESLVEELNQTSEKILILHATIGYGKTVLLAQYARRSESFCAWYHLDSLDNDVSTFLQYLVSSLQHAMDDFVFDLDAYGQIEEFLPTRIVRDLVAELTDYITSMPGKRLSLILDDFQALENPMVFQMLEEFLDNINGFFTLAVATKSSVPGFLSKYMAKNQVRLLDFEKLSFCREEVWGVLSNVLSPEEADQYTDMVYKNMEGWPAGVMFAALYLRQMGSRASEVEWVHVSQQSLVQNYIMYELFRNLPYDIQQFLLQTSFADELSPELCNEICGVSNAAGTLRYLLQENMFMTHVGGKSGSYRYHSMFRSFLRDQAGEAVRLEVCEKIAGYYLKQGEMTVAAKYALEAGAGDLLEIIIEKSGISMLKEGKRSLVANYLMEIHAYGGGSLPMVQTTEGILRILEGDWENGLPLLEAAAKTEEVGPGYHRFYAGIRLQNEEGTREAGEESIREGCRLLREKKRDLPPLAEDGKKTVEMIWEETGDAGCLTREKPLLVSCFGKFEVRAAGAKNPVSWRTRKAMELFAFLLDLEGKPVERRTLLEQLWPDNAPNNSVAMLHNMIHSIRKELNAWQGCRNLIRYQDRKYSLNMALVSSDLDTMKQFCAFAEQGNLAELFAHREEILNLHGTYLEEVDGLWCMPRRAYFERMYGKICQMLAADCEERQDYEDAIAFWTAYRSADRYAEDAVAGLLRCYGRLGDRKQMKRVFVSAQKIFREEMETELSEEIVAIYEKGTGKRR